MLVWRKLPFLQGAAKKMTQHVKCDYLVTPENFCPNLVGLFSRFVVINVLICLKLLHVYQIGITPKFKFRFCNYTLLYLLHAVTFWTVIAKFTKKVENELHKIDKSTYSYAWTVTELAAKLKSGNCRPKQREQLRTLNAPQMNNSMW